MFFPGKVLFLRKNLYKMQNRNRKSPIFGAIGEMCVMYDLRISFDLGLPYAISLLKIALG